MRQFSKGGVFLAAALLALGFLAFSLGTAQAESKYERRSRENKEACEQWCKANPDSCAHCRSTATCGTKYKKVKSFGGKGKNWYACEKELSRKEAGERNKADCEKWCKKNPESCTHCRSTPTCGTKYKATKTFGGKGKNWYACNDKGSHNKTLCERWCKEHPDICSHCRSTSTCGSKAKKIKSFRGKGKNWFACQKQLSRDELEQEHKEACKKWCEENPEKCSHCRSTPTCGGNARKVMTFGGKGKNWYACKRTQ